MYYRWAFIPLIWRLFSYLHIRRFRFLMTSNPTNPANLSNPLPSFRECKTFMMTYKWHMIAISTNPLPLSFPSHLFIERCPIFYCCHFLVKKCAIALYIEEVSCSATEVNSNEFTLKWTELKWVHYLPEFHINSSIVSQIFQLLKYIPQ